MTHPHSEHLRGLLTRAATLFTCRPAQASVAWLLLAWLPLVAQAQSPTVRFAPAATYDTGEGSNPISIAVADVNSDYVPDLLTANSSNNTVRVLLGTGDGTFRTAAAFSTGGNAPLSLAVADVNADGKPDLLTANASSNTVGVLLGTGNGIFRTAATFSTGAGSNPNSLAVADVNGDGKPDLLTANAGSNTAGVLLGTGDGTFRAAATFNTGGYPLSLAVADVNGDGKPDLLTANAGSNTAGVLLGNGDGTFRTATIFGTGGNPISLAVADINGDGKPDLLTANSSSNTAGVLLGNGDGTFRPAATFGTGTGSYPYSLAVADVNGDGKPDLLTANNNSSTAGVLLGTGDGTFRAGTFSTGTGSNPRGIAVADVNGDGKPDLLTANIGSNTAGVLLNTTVYYAPTLMDSNPTSGPVGTSVTLTGINLSGATFVAFNDFAAPFVVNNATTVTATVPTGATSGPITVTTPGGTSNRLPFTVVAPVTLTTASPLPGGTVGVAYSQTFQATGGSGTYTFALAPGAGLPPGFILASNGSFVGRPTGGGSFTFTVQATDNSPAPGPYSGAKQYTLTIAAPTITVGPTSLPGGTAGQAYSQTLTAAGGTAPYTYALVAGTGTLPNGLTLNSAGTLSGTPTQSGAFSFTVRATDASTGTGPYSAPRAYSLSIAPAPAPTLTSFTPSSGPVGTQVTITGMGFTSSTTVAFNDAAATVTVASATSLTATVPASATTGPIRVMTSAGTATSSTAFTVRTAPVANADAYTTGQSQALAVPPNSGVLANDRSPDGLSLTATLSSQPTHGTLTLNPDGSFTYVPAAGYSGTDSFTYQARDSGSPSLSSNVTTARLTVQPPACAAPTDVAVGQVNFTSATVSFTASPAASGGYVVSYAPSSGLALTVAATASPVQLTGLTPNTTYYVTVASQCDGGQTAGSVPPVSFITPALRIPENPAGTTAGLTYQYYEASGANFTSLPTFASLTPTTTGTTTGFDERSLRQRNYGYALRYMGYVTVPTDGQYTFFTNSDDGSQLFIGNQLVVDNDGNHGTRELAGSIGLQAGTHLLTVTYYQDGGDDQLSVSYQGLGVAKQLIPGASLRVVLPTALRPADNPSGTTAGLLYQYYEAAPNTSYTRLPTFAASTPKQTGATASLDERSLRQRNYGYALRFTGYVTVPTDGIYSFYTNSDDGSQLFIGSTLVVDNDGDHGVQERTGSIGLQAGTHAFTVTYYQDGGDDQLSVSYQGPGVSKQVLPAASFSYQSASPLRAPENPSGTMAGLRYQYYESATTYAQLPTFATEAVRKVGTTTSFDERSLAQRSYGYALRYSGYVTVPADGQYTFFTNSDDGSQLFIGSTLVVDNDGNHDVRERSGTIGLQAGTHAFTVTYYQDGGGDALGVSYQGPGVVKQAIPAASLRYVPASASTSATRALLATTDRVGGAALAVQAYPNPFTSDVTLTFVLPQAGAYTLAVYDVTGRLVEQLPGGTASASEQRQVRWAAGGYASGLYLLRLRSAAGTQQLRLTKQ